MGPAMAAIFTRYELYAGAAGFSPAHIDDMRNSVRYFDQFLGVIRDPAAVTPMISAVTWFICPPSRSGRGSKTNRRDYSAVPVSIPTRGRLRHFSNGWLMKR